MSGRTRDPLALPEARRAPLEAVYARLLACKRPLLTTHVNADGDGAGSEVALAAWLADHGRDPVILNPTPFPERFQFLLADNVVLADPSAAADVMNTADLLVVLDTGEPRRLGKVARAARDRDVVVIDHHPPSSPGIEAVASVLEPAACATGELLYDLFRLDDAEGGTAWSSAVVEGLYAAIVTDTGSFRFANTTERTHAIAGDLVGRGVDPERMYRHLYGTVPLRRVEVLRAALENLEVDSDHAIAWITIPRRVTTELHADADDLDGVIEHARSIEGTEVALLFKETVEGGTKVSLRSNGDVDVNAIARAFGGGGHVKAAGALIGRPMGDARPAVLEAVRRAVRSLESPPDDD